MGLFIEFFCVVCDVFLASVDLFKVLPRSGGWVSTPLGGWCAWIGRWFVFAAPSTPGRGNRRPRGAAPPGGRHWCGLSGVRGGGRGADRRRHLPRGPRGPPNPGSCVWGWGGGRCPAHLRPELCLDQGLGGLGAATVSRSPPPGPSKPLAKTLFLV